MYTFYKLIYKLCSHLALVSKSGQVMFRFRINKTAHKGNREKRHKTIDKCFVQGMINNQKVQLVDKRCVVSIVKVSLIIVNCSK